MTFAEKIALIEVKTRKPGRFKELCSSVYQSVEGAELLAFLVAAAHPLDHSEGLSENEHGQRQVVASLWQNGSGSNVIYTIHPDDPKGIQDAPEGAAKG